MWNDSAWPSQQLGGLMAMPVWSPFVFLSTITHSAKQVADSLYVEYPFPLWSANKEKTSHHNSSPLVICPWAYILQPGESVGGIQLTLHRWIISGGLLRKQQRPRSKDGRQRCLVQSFCTCEPNAWSALCLEHWAFSLCTIRFVIALINSCPVLSLLRFRSSAPRRGALIIVRSSVSCWIFNFSCWGDASYCINQIQLKHFIQCLQMWE